MAGQVSYHLLADAGATHAPWAITTVVSCLPVLVLGMGTALAHMLRADAAAADRSGTTNDAPDRGTGGPARPPVREMVPADQAAGVQAPVLSGDRTARSPCRDHRDTAGPVTAPAARTALNTYPEPDETRLIARRLAAAGKPVSRRTLRSNGATGSNAQLGTQREGAPAGRQTESALPGLTPAEQAVARLVATGRSNWQTAAEL